MALYSWVGLTNAFEVISIEGDFEEVCKRIKEVVASFDHNFWKLVSTQEITGTHGNRRLVLFFILS